MLVLMFTEASIPDIHFFYISFIHQHFYGYLECKWSCLWWHRSETVALCNGKSARYLCGSFSRAGPISKNSGSQWKSTRPHLDVSETWHDRNLKNVFIRNPFLIMNVMIIIESFLLFYLIHNSRQKIMSSLSPNAVYEELVSVRLVGMMLTIVVRQELRKNVVRYSTQTVGTGALNFMVSSFYAIIWIKIDLKLQATGACKICAECDI